MADDSSKHPIIRDANHVPLRKGLYLEREDLSLFEFREEYDYGNHPIFYSLPGNQKKYPSLTDISRSFIWIHSPAFLAKKLRDLSDILITRNSEFSSLSSPEIQLAQAEDYELIKADGGHIPGR
ncbi:hypothetical protein J4463_00265 [Candidatus Pacearchaeota archaeon]|nr:hypothetical protein [Candidatus Pacearchaeota archaeon]